MKKGIALVELLVAMGIMALILPALITAFFSARGGRVADAQRLQAAGLVREAKEAVRIVRDSGWSNLPDSTVTPPISYHPAVIGSTWGLASGEETIDTEIGLKRKILFSSVYRDGLGNLTTTETGNTLDPSVKHVEVSVTYGPYEI
jgi:type II secretory pathway pseudopilin PulG